MAVFTVADNLLVRALPYRDGSRLVMTWETGDDQNRSAQGLTILIELKRGQIARIGKAPCIEEGIAGVLEGGAVERVVARFRDYFNLPANRAAGFGGEQGRC